MAQRFCLLLLFLVIGLAQWGVAAPKGGLVTSLNSCEASLDASPPSYPWTGAAQGVAGQVELSIVLVQSGPGQDDYQVTFDCPPGGSVTPSSFTVSVTAGSSFPVNYQKAITVTLPADPGQYTYKALVNGVEQDTMIAYVVKLVSLLPDQGVVFDDGSSDPDTVAYAIPIAASGNVTVTATANPTGISEANLPSSWSLTGGSGTGKYSRTVGKATSAMTVISCTCGSTTKTAKIYVYTASITSMPSLCAGGYSDAAHQDTISVRAEAGGMGIPNASVELALASPLPNLPADLKPTFGTTTLTTDTNGNASTTLTSGKAVLPSVSGMTYSTANVQVKLAGYAVPGSDTALSITAPTMTVAAYYPGTTDPVTVLYLYGDYCDLIGQAIWTRSSTQYNVTGTHDLNWRFKFWESEEAPSDPENDATYDFDGIVSDEDAEFTWLTEYGLIEDQDVVDEELTATYTTGTHAGWIWWYMDDADAQFEE